MKITTTVVGFWHRVVAWFAPQPPPVPLLPAVVVIPPEPEPEPESVPVPEPVRALMPVALAMDERRPPSSSGEFYFKETILEQLESYMLYVRRMKRGDREAYNLYSQIGAHIMPSPPVTDTELSPWWRASKSRPAFGAVAYGVHPDTEQIETEHKMLIPRFLYFQKYKVPPATVEHSNAGEMYSVTTYWDKATFPKIKHGSPMQFPVLVMDDGEVRLLRTKLTATQTIHHKHGKARGTTSHIDHQRWGIHPEFLSWAAEKNKSPQEMLAGVFIAAANCFEMANASMIRVSATKQHTTAVFAVDITRTPYFFKDREQVYDQDGRKKRIFHIVKTHPRRRAGDQRSSVRTHFRGLRRFRWNGYDVAISVPTLHHLDLTSFALGATDFDEAVEGKDYMDMKKVGEQFAKHIAEGHAFRPFTKHLELESGL